MEISIMTELNAERSRLLAPFDFEDELKQARKEMRELVDYLSTKYTNSTGEIDIAEAINGMGLKIITESTSNSITITTGNTVLFSVVAEDGTPEFKAELTRLLGIYLFTNEARPDGYFDTKLSNEDEKKVSSFILVFNIPELDFSTYLSIDKLIRLSIEFNVPLPILRETIAY